MRKANASSDGDLSSYEGKYPKDLFNKTVLAGNETIGHVVRETDDLIVVFGDSDNSRYDIPKSTVALSGGSVVVRETESVAQYLVDRDSPLPEGKSLRPSAEEIRTIAKKQQADEERKVTTPDKIMNEGRSLALAPRPETINVATPEGYVDTESELSKKMKRAARELKEIIIAGTKVAKKKAKRAKEKAAAKQADSDRQVITRMGTLAGTFANSFEDILSEIRTRTYADQVDIYSGFLKLLDQQRQLILARRDLAVRLRDSVDVPVVEPGDMKKRSLKAPPKLPSPDQVKAPKKSGTEAA